MHFHHRTPHHRAASVGLTVLVLATPLPAAAHAILVASQPAIGGSVPAGPIAFDLHYNSRIDRDLSRVTLTHPDHSQSTLPIASAGAVDEIKTAATLTPGAYVLRWQVLAIDGHITRGDIPFSVTGP